MTKHFCNVCGKKYIEEDLVALLTEEDDSTADIIEDAVCPECCNEIKEFILNLKKENTMLNLKHMLMKMKLLMKIFGLRMNL